MNANNNAFLGDMFMVISVSPLAPPAAPKCADVTELMGLKKVTYCSPVVSSPSERLPETQTEASAHALAHKHTCTPTCPPPQSLVYALS